MRMMFLIFLTCLGVLSASSLEDGKKYVSHDQVFINENGIFVYHSNLWHRVTQLQHDNCGLYYVPSKDSYWICPICDSYNSEFADKCWKCDYPRSRS